MRLTRRTDGRGDSGSHAMRKRLAILGSTGSVGVNTLDIVQQHPERFAVVGLAAGSNIELLEHQMRRFRPLYVSLFDLQRAKELRERTSDLGIEVIEGTNGACSIASLPEVDLVLSAIVGGAGLAPTLSAIRAGRDVAIANKEPLVMAGGIGMRGGE